MNYLLFAGFALLASALNTIFNRISANKISTLVSAVLKSFFIIIATFIITCCLGDLDHLYNLTDDEWLWVGLLGLITSADWIFYFLSIKRAHLEAFAPFEASSVLFCSNTLFLIFDFSVVTNGATLINTIFFFVGLAFLFAAMLFAILNKKINPSTKKIWILYAFLSALMMGFTLIVVKYRLSNVPSSVISYHQMVIVFVVCSILMLVTKSYKELKSVKMKDFINFFVAAIFNALLMVFRYMALNAPGAKPPVINCIISLDFVLVSFATVLFFKANNKFQLAILIILVVCGMAFNVFAQMI